jgi:ubiquinone/menaquinone biosynthesis C-methylase UbiE
MERVDPRVTFGKRAGFYATSEAHKEKESLEAFSKVAGIRPGHLALDVATGTGHAAAALSERGAEVVGLDLTSLMLAEARRLYGARAGTHWVLGDVMNLPFAEGRFDLVTSRRAPHHFPDIEGALRSMRRVLRPGGALVIDDRSVPEDDYVDRTMNHLDVLHDRSHVRQYRLSEWKAMLGRNGFVTESAESYQRRRPLTSLTGNAEADDAEEIRAIVGAMSPDERMRMAIEEQGGEVTVMHWFVLLRARRV